MPEMRGYGDFPVSMGDSGGCPRRGGVGYGEILPGMDDQGPVETPSPGAGVSVPAGEPPRLLTLVEAAAVTGVSRKALHRRLERQTLRGVKDPEGRWRIPRGELQRAGLLDENGRAALPGGEVVVWRDLYQQEREAREQADAHARTLELQLTAIVHAGFWRARRIRRELRDTLGQPTGQIGSSGP